MNGLDHENGDDASLDEKDTLTTNGQVQDQQISPSLQASPNTATAALALSSRFQREGESILDENEPPIHDADLQAFFPSKRRPPAEWGGSWGRRLDSIEEIQNEKRTIFSMLDDFEGQPPFTIQRLCELILRPTEHHHTLAKYVSALKRLLSVTATRDAFPASGADDEDEGYIMTGVAGEAVNGHAVGSRASRIGTPVPGSPSTAPLFSPIPFLMHTGDEGMPGKAEIDDMAMSDEDIPGMELGGADRTSEEAVETAVKAGAGGHSAITSGRTSTERRENDRANEHERAIPLANAATEGTPSTASNIDRLDSSTDVVTSAGNGPHNSLPLGVPSGRVDELDQLGGRHGQLPPVESGTPGGGAKALTSTTTSSNASQPDSIGYTEADDASRAIKRVRSDKSLSELDGEGVESAK